MGASKNRFYLMSVRIAGTVIMAVSLTGCEAVHEYSLTYRLWTNGEMSNYAEPASDPRLAVFAHQGGQDVLVQYDETSEKNDQVRRRAYFLDPNTEAIAQHKRPRFVDPQAAATMMPVPRSQTQLWPTNVSPGQTSPAVCSEYGREFSLLRDGQVDGPYALPTYCESNGTLVRATLTPFAVAGDSVMVGMVAALVALVWACESGFSFAP
jgi:hypothetical protein